jgi:arginine repressor
VFLQKEQDGVVVTQTYAQTVEKEINLEKKYVLREEILKLAKQFEKRMTNAQLGRRLKQLHFRRIPKGHRAKARDLAYWQLTGRFPS